MDYKFKEINVRDMEYEDLNDAYSAMVECVETFLNQSMRVLDPIERFTIRHTFELPRRGGGKYQVMNRTQQSAKLEAEGTIISAKQLKKIRERAQAKLIEFMMGE